MFALAGRQRDVHNFRPNPRTEVNEVFANNHLRCDPRAVELCKMLHVADPVAMIVHECTRLSNIDVVGFGKLAVQPNR
jgi:hypothetical protein